jgi:hypothetical protein
MRTIAVSGLIAVTAVLGTAAAAAVAAPAAAGQGAHHRFSGVRGPAAERFLRDFHPLLRG